MENIAPYVMQNRKYIVNVVRHMSVEQLNVVPRGFNNSIIWNIGHMTASLYEMFYLMTGHTLSVKEKYHADFRIGTRPSWVDPEEIIMIKQLHLQSVWQFDEDFRSGLFDGYQAYARQNINASSLTDLSNHFLFHEGLHFNNIMVLKRIILLENSSG